MTCLRIHIACCLHQAFRQNSTATFSFRPPPLPHPKVLLSPKITPSLLLLIYIMWWGRFAVSKFPPTPSFSILSFYVISNPLHET